MLLYTGITDYTVHSRFVGIFMTDAIYVRS